MNIADNETYRKIMYGNELRKRTEYSDISELLSSFSQKSLAD